MSPYYDDFYDEGIDGPFSRVWQDEWKDLNRTHRNQTSKGAGIPSLAAWAGYYTSPRGGGDPNSLYDNPSDEMVFDDLMKRAEFFQPLAAQGAGYWRKTPRGVQWARGPAYREAGSGGVQGIRQYFMQTRGYDPLETEWGRYVALKYTKPEEYYNDSGPIKQRLFGSGGARMEEDWEEAIPDKKSPTGASWVSKRTVPVEQKTVPDIYRDLLRLDSARSADLPEGMKPSMNFAPERYGPKTKTLYRTIAPVDWSQGEQLDRPGYASDADQQRIAAAIQAQVNAAQQAKGGNPNLRQTEYLLQALNRLDPGAVMESEGKLGKGGGKGPAWTKDKELLVNIGADLSKILGPDKAVEVSQLLETLAAGGPQALQPSIVAALKKLNPGKYRTFEPRPAPPSEQRGYFSPALGRRVTDDEAREMYTYNPFAPKPSSTTSTKPAAEKPVQFRQPSVPGVSVPVIQDPYRSNWNIPHNEGPQAFQDITAAIARLYKQFQQTNDVDAFIRAMMQLSGG